MGIFRMAVHSKIDKFESAINLEIRGQIKVHLVSFYLSPSVVSSKSWSELCSAFGDLTWI